MNRLLTKMDIPSQSDKINRLKEIITGDILEVGDDFNEFSNLHDAGLDSMATMQLLIKIEQTFGVQISAIKLTKENLSTIDNLARLI
ncbi:acyl carrier protein [bacterium]|jgi:acyl carrier protein|nr:acyl carrier protein [bacterium]NBS51688.1 acyl carrier protein [Spartobacteria bacterium]